MPQGKIFAMKVLFIVILLDASDTDMVREVCVHLYG